ncbi:unnamed protein product [Sphagnum troendelagicum]|uniref:Uncharacterized protein n=1 Tax=Sphagnum troendelagicum TaxID=128251 RepID=A0ABP0TNS5_9BRYO
MTSTGNRSAIRSNFKRLGWTNPLLKYGVPLISLFSAPWAWPICSKAANISCCFVFFFFWRFQGLQELEQIDGKAWQLLKDVLSAQDDQEWQATALSQSLTGEGPVAGAEKKKLNLEEEHKKVEVKPFDYKPIPRPKRSEN